jgi:hypothetical protein
MSQFSSCPRVTLACILYVREVGSPNILCVIVIHRFTPAIHRFLAPPCLEIESYSQLLTNLHHHDPTESRYLRHLTFFLR